MEPKMRAALHEIGHVFGFAYHGIATREVSIDNAGAGLTMLATDDVSPEAEVLGAMAGHVAPRICGDYPALENGPGCDGRFVGEALSRLGRVDAAAWARAERAAASFVFAHSGPILAAANQLYRVGKMTLVEIRAWLPEELRFGYPVSTAKPRSYSDWKPKLKPAKPVVSDDILDELDAEVGAAVQRMGLPAVNKFVKSYIARRYETLVPRY